jgi:hypothetical protein
MKPLWFKRVIRLGYTGPDVDIVRNKFGLGPGPYDRTTQELVRGLARKRHIETDGEINEAVAVGLGPAADEDLAPTWFTRELALWCEGDDVRQFRWALGFSDNDNRFHPEEEAAVMRLQSAQGLTITGRVNEDLAKHIGEAPRERR